ncbi:MAG: fused response regulator/thioredoxin-disulfide reductase, partial [Cyanothece sp. SIO2G6]|nr:fused response regulator/thioredoxin-disulfide reductase [Cyanothece sp. SIO2G6]
DSSVIEAKGESRLESLVIENSQTGEVQTLPAKSLFIFIGAVPYTDWLDELLHRDQRGFILTGGDLAENDATPSGQVNQRCQGWSLERDPYLLETNVPGIFAVGDVRHGSVKRVASGVGEGSICVQFIHRYLSNL